MGMGQTLLVLLAIVLFSTLVIGVYTSMAYQLDLVRNNMYLTQSLKICDAVLHKIEAELVGNARNFDTLPDDLNDEYPIFLDIGSATYEVSVIGAFSDGLGVTNPPPATNDHITIGCHIIMQHRTNPNIRLEFGAEDVDSRFRKVLSRI